MRISDWSSDVCSSDLRLHHLHAGDGVILPLGVAIILQDYVRARSQPVTGVMRLLDREGQPVIAYRAAGHRLFGQSAPAAADLPQRIALAKVEPVEDGVDLVRQSTRLNSSH